MWIQTGWLQHRSILPLSDMLPLFSNVVWDMESSLTLDRVMELEGKFQEKNKVWMRQRDGL